MTLVNMQHAICNALKRDPWQRKRNVEFFAEDKGNIIAAVKTKVAQMGLCAVVSTPGLNSDKPDSFTPVGLSNVVVTCFESPQLNRSKANRTTALNAAERIACVLAKALFNAHVKNPAVFGPPAFVKIESGMVGENERDAMLVYTVTFRVLAELTGDMEKEPYDPNIGDGAETPEPEPTEE